MCHIVYNHLKSNLLLNLIRKKLKYLLGLHMQERSDML